MAKKTLEELIVRIDANTSRLNKKLTIAEKKVSASSNKMRKSFTGADQGILKMAKSLRGLAVIAGAAALFRAVEGAAAFGDELVNTANKLGIGVVALQELQFAAKQTGVETRTFNLALQRFTRRSAEAAQGTGEAKQALKDLGIQLKDTQGNLRPTEDLLNDVADAFARIENPSERLRLAFKLFDSEGAALVNTLSGGSKVLKDFGREAQRLGLIMEEDVARRAGELTADFTRLSQVINVSVKSALINIGVGFKDAFGLGKNDPATLIRRTTEEVTLLSKELKVLEENQVLRKLGVSIGGKRISGTELDRQVADKRAEIAALNKIIGKDVSKATPVGPVSPAGAQREKTIRNLEIQAANQERLAEALGQSKSLHQEIADIIRIENAVRALGSEATQEQKRQVEELTARQIEAEQIINKQVEANQRLQAILSSTRTAEDIFIERQTLLNTAVQEGTISVEQYNKSLEVLKDRLDKAKGNKQEGLGAIESILSSIPDSFVEAALAGEDFGDRMANVFQDVVKEIQRAILKMLILKAIQGVGNFISPGAGTALTQTLSGKAGGGPVGARQPVLIGEKGPEVFLPKVPGVVIPNQALQTAGGAQAAIEPKVNIIIHNNSSATVTPQSAPNGRDIEILIENVAVRSMGSGALNRATRQSFNLKNATNIG